MADKEKNPKPAEEDEELDDLLDSEYYKVICTISSLTKNEDSNGPGGCRVLSMHPLGGPPLHLQLLHTFQ